MPLLTTCPGIRVILGYTIATEIGAIERFPSPRKLTGYTGLCPRVYQSGDSDYRGPLSKHGPRYLRWAFIEAAHNAARHPLYQPVVERTQARLGKKRGRKIANLEIARRLAEATWYMSPATSMCSGRRRIDICRSTARRVNAPPEQSSYRPHRPREGAIDS